jgi:hypothetical protein
MILSCGMGIIESFHQRGANGLIQVMEGLKEEILAFAIKNPVKRRVAVNR